MKRSNILRLIIGSQILGLMTVPCALSMEKPTETQRETSPCALSMEKPMETQRETSINDVPKGPIQIISSFLSLADCSHLGQTSKKFNKFMEELKWNRTITFCLWDNMNVINNLKAALDQLHRFNLPKNDNIQETKKEQEPEGKEKKRKIGTDQEQGANKKLKTEQQKIKSFKKIAHLNIEDIDDLNMKTVQGLLVEYKDYIEYLTVELLSGIEGNIPEFIKNTNITSLCFGGQYLLENDVIDIAEILKENKTIRWIKLYHNIISEEVEYIVEMLKENKTVESINLSGINMSDENVKDVAKVLEENMRITSIEMILNQISAEGAKSIAKMLEKNKTIRLIELGWNDISDEGAIAIAEALKKNESITYIDLPDNDISDDGIIAMAEMLKTNKTIESINFCENQFSDKGAKAIAKMLETNETLISIDLGADIGDEGIIALAEALKTNKTIELINLVSNTVTAKGINAIIEMLNINEAIQFICLRLNGNFEARFQLEQLAERKQIQIDIV